MVGTRKREARQTIYLHARLREDEGWRDVTICNVSSRGMMLRVDPQLPRGTFVEVRHRGEVMVGRVVWASGIRCGVRTQDTIDIAALLATGAVRPRRPGEERRAVPRAPVTAARTIAERHQASRRAGRLFEWALLVVAVVGGGLFVADTARAALDRPLSEVRTALAR